MNTVEGRQILVRFDAKELWENLYLFATKKEKQVEEIRWTKMKEAMESVYQLHEKQIRYFSFNKKTNHKRQMISLYSEMWYELKIMIVMDFSEYEDDLLLIFHEWYPFLNKEKTL